MKVFRWTVILLIALFLLALVLRPVRRVEERSYPCRICGKRNVVTTRYVLGIYHSQSESNPPRVPVPDLFGQYIDEEHEHQWAPGRFTATTWRLWGKTVTDEGIVAAPPWPAFQGWLTDEGLEIASLLGDSPVEFRREVFHRVIDITTERGCQEVAALRGQLEAVPAGQRQAVARQWLGRGS